MNELIFSIKSMYQKKFFIPAVTLLLLCFSTATASFAEQHLTAQNGEEEQWIARQPTFSELDKDQDGTINNTEAESWQELNSKFDKVDKDNNQKIDRAEFSAFENQLIEESILEFTSPEQ